VRLRVRSLLWRPVGTHRSRAYNRAMAADGARMWIFTGSPDDDAATLGHGAA
jgi:hypothetical protein